MANNQYFKNITLEQALECMPLSIEKTTGANMTLQVHRLLDGTTVARYADANGDSIPVFGKREDSTNELLSVLLDKVSDFMTPSQLGTVASKALVFEKKNKEPLKTKTFDELKFTKQEPEERTISLDKEQTPSKIRVSGIHEAFQGADKLYGDPIYKELTEASNESKKCDFNWMHVEDSKMWTDGCHTGIDWSMVKGIYMMNHDHADVDFSDLSDWLVRLDKASESNRESERLEAERKAYTVEISKELDEDLDKLERLVARHLERRAAADAGRAAAYATLELCKTLENLRGNSIMYDWEIQEYNYMMDDLYNRARHAGACHRMVYGVPVRYTERKPRSRQCEKKPRT